MQFLRRKFVLLLLVAFVYAAYFLTHLPKQTPQQILGVQSNLQLFTEPYDGKTPLIDTLTNATKTIDVEVYLLSDADVVKSLVDACQRGVVVRVMLEQHPFGGGNINEKTMESLSHSCVHAQWTNSIYALTHEKTVVIDAHEVWILNQNLTTSSFSKNREYDIFDTNMQDVSEVKTIFAADWERKTPTISDPNLLVSPVNSREKLQGLLASSSKTLDIETEVIDDPDTVNALIAKAKTTTVRIIIPSFTQVTSNKKTAQKLIAAGIFVKTLSSPYIHAKLILEDAKAYVGSVNLTTQSMDNNREIGILISQQDIVTRLHDYFETDWEKAEQVQ